MGSSPHLVAGTLPKEAANASSSFSRQTEVVNLEYPKASWSMSRKGNTSFLHQKCTNCFVLPNGPKHRVAEHSHELLESRGLTPP